MIRENTPTALAFVAASLFGKARKIIHLSITRACSAIEGHQMRLRKI